MSRSRSLVSMSFFYSRCRAFVGIAAGNPLIVSQHLKYAIQLHNIRPAPKPSCRQSKSSTLLTAQRNFSPYLLLRPNTAFVLFFRKYTVWVFPLLPRLYRRGFYVQSSRSISTMYTHHIRSLLPPASYPGLTSSLKRATHLSSQETRASSLLRCKNYRTLWMA